jgi:DNA-binding GntR family transcriptional regulator
MRGTGRATSSSLAREAYAVIRERILRGDVAVGQVISRRTVASELGMSFLPVSEAFLRLEFEGLLESRPRAGTRVRIPNREDVEGSYVVREALETQAARLYAQFATVSEHAAMTELAVRVDDLASSKEADRALYLTLHEQLHRQIAEYGRCQALCEAIKKTCALASVWLCIGRSFSEGPSHPPCHQDLLAALGKWEPEEAARAMEFHISAGREMIMSRLEPYFALGDPSERAYTRSRKLFAAPVSPLLVQ